MAEKKPEPAAEEGAPPKKKKLLLFIIIGVVVLVLGGGAAVMLLKKKPVDEEGEDGEEPPAKHAKADKKKKSGGHGDAPPTFVKLDPFTVKLQTEQNESYLQATPELQVAEPTLGDKIKLYNPAIRHKVTLILMSRKASEVSTPKGVQALANEIRYEITKIIDGPKAPPKKSKKGKPVEEEPEEIPEHADPNDSVQAVLFTQFIIQ